MEQTVYLTGMKITLGGTYKKLAMHIAEFGKDWNHANGGTGEDSKTVFRKGSVVPPLSVDIISDICHLSFYPAKLPSHVARLLPLPADELYPVVHSHRHYLTPPVLETLVLVVPAKTQRKTKLFSFRTSYLDLVFCFCGSRVGIDIGTY